MSAALLRRATSLLALVVVGAAPVTSSADTAPSVWERAARPDMAETFDLHVEVERRIAQGGDVGFAQRRAARSILENAHAETSPDVRLRFDLGKVYLALGSDDASNYARARRVLSRTLAEAPDHPMAEEGWLWLAFACGHTGDHACERSAYREVLRRASEEAVLATPTLNLAETEMHLGNLREAADGYREAIRLAGRLPNAGQTAPLAIWGLSVALDRSGDGLGAEQQASFAIELERSMGLVGPVSQLLHSTDVFFVPDYEVLWYDGLGATVQAKKETRPERKAQLLTIAQRSFAAYVKRGEAAGDRWLEIARVRLASVQAELSKLKLLPPSKRRATPVEGEDIAL